MRTVKFLMMVGFLFITLLPTANAGYDLKITSSYIEESTNINITISDMLSDTNVTIGDTITISFSIRNYGDTVSTPIDVLIGLNCEDGETLIDNYGRTHWDAKLYRKTDIVIPTNSKKDFVYEWNTAEWIHTPSYHTIDFLPNPGRYFIFLSYYPTDYLEDETDNNSGHAFSEDITLNAISEKEKSEKENPEKEKILYTACCVGIVLMAIIVLIVIIFVYQNRAERETKFCKEVDTRDTTIQKTRDKKIASNSVIDSWEKNQ